MKKVGKIVVALLLVVSVTWSAVSTFLLYRSRQIPAHIKPVITQADQYSFVGQMRLPKIWEGLKLNKTEDFADLEFMGLEKGVFYDNIDEYFDVLQFKITLREELLEDEYLLNFWIYHYCPEDGFWYMVYCPFYSSKLMGYTASGEILKKYSVPPDILAEPGRYAFVLENLGNCSFEVE